MSDGAEHRIDQLHFRVVRKIAHRNARRNTDLNHTALLVAFQVVGALLDHLGRRAVCVLLEHLAAHCRKTQRAERCFIFTEKTIAESHNLYRPFPFTPFPYLPRAECNPRTRGR